MRGFLINKNLCFYYWLRKKIGKRRAMEIANTIEKTILIFGRETMPCCSRDGILTEKQEAIVGLRRENRADEATDSFSSRS
jgi:hypothetical protein